MIEGISPPDNPSLMASFENLTEDIKLNRDHASLSVKRFPQEVSIGDIERIYAIRRDLMAPGDTRNSINNFLKSLSYIDRSLRHHWVKILLSTGTENILVDEKNRYAAHFLLK